MAEIASKEEKRAQAEAALFELFQLIGVGTSIELFQQYCIKTAAEAYKERDKKGALLYQRVAAVIDSVVLKIVKIEEKL